MLIEERPSTEQPVRRPARRLITSELAEVSRPRAVIAWVAMGLTVAIAIALLLGL